MWMLSSPSCLVVPVNCRLFGLFLAGFGFIMSPLVYPLPFSGMWPATPSSACGSCQLTFTVPAATHLKKCESKSQIGAVFEIQLLAAQHQFEIKQSFVFYYLGM